jgi:hypothetical protein
MWANLVVPAVVELGRAGRGVVGDHRGLLQRATLDTSFLVMRRTLDFPLRAILPTATW